MKDYIASRIIASHPSLENGCAIEINIIVDRISSVEDIAQILPTFTATLEVERPGGNTIVAAGFGTSDDGKRKCEPLEIK
jgi:hypothetical protein